MNKVFENFVSTALTDALAPFGGAVRLQYSGRHLDRERALRLIPDITWWHHGRVRAIIDAKYKRLADARFPNADAYQMLAYCTGFALPQGYLIYARDRPATVPPAASTRWAHLDRGPRRRCRAPAG